MPAGLGWLSSSLSLAISVLRRSYSVILRCKNDWVITAFSFKPLGVSMYA